jgi:putative flavoprotein involved in K+ transport
MRPHSPAEQINKWLRVFEQLLIKNNINAASRLFQDDCYWRDLLSFTWNIKTCEGGNQIADMLRAVLLNVQPINWKQDGEATEIDGVIESWITFETSVARGRGQVRLIDGKCWTLFTAMDELKNHEEKKGKSRDRGATHGPIKGRKSWLDNTTSKKARLGYEEQPYCVIIGGGQGGIALGARLRRLDVPTIIVETNVYAGDSWRKRYKSLCLHDTVWYDHMPYLPFPDDWPIYTPKDKLGDWLEAYVKIMELNYWTASTCQSAAYDDTTGEWAVTIMRDGALVTLRPKHIVLATGMSGVPIMPELTGTDKFKGKIVHSSEHIGGEGYQGKKCVIIGSNNSAHDICADLWEHGADVTMVQRSSTLVAKSDTLFKLGSSKLYSEEALEKGITTDIADMISASRPYRILTELSKPTCIELQKHDQDFYERLKKAGFILDFGEDGSGLFMKYIRRGSGYYIDVGASELIANGDVKLQTGQVAGLSETSILMEDGSVLESDLIVCATGYGSMNGWAAKLISKDVANKVGKVWGIGSGTTNDPGPWEGELRNIWKPTQQDGLWFHGGNLAQSRFYSQFLALQIKARAVDISTPVYALQESYHRN